MDQFPLFRNMQEIFAVKGHQPTWSNWHE